MSEDAATDESPPATSAPAGETADTPDEATGETEPDATSSEPPEPEPTPQTEALRRQQLYVGTGVSALAGVAVVVAGIQQFPGFSLLVYLLFGMATTTLLFGLLVASMFASASE